MGAASSLKRCLRGWRTLHGRAPPSDLRWWLAFAVLVEVLASGADDLLAAGLGIRNGVLLAGTLVLLPPSVAVIVRRLHDLDRSGWWCALATAFCVGLPVFHLDRPEPRPVLTALLVGGILGLSWLCHPGTPGANRYGLSTSVDYAGLFGGDDPGPAEERPDPSRC